MIDLLCIVARLHGYIHFSPCDSSLDKCFIIKLRCSRLPYSRLYIDIISPVSSINSIFLSSGIWKVLVVNWAAAVDEVAVRMVDDVVHEIFPPYQLSFFPQNIKRIIGQILHICIFNALVCRQSQLQQLLVAMLQVVDRRRQELLLLEGVLGMLTFICFFSTVGLALAHGLVVKVECIQEETFVMGQD